MKRRKPARLRKTVLLNVRMTPADRTVIRRRALAMKMSVSKLVRDSVMGDFA